MQEPITEDQMLQNYASFARFLERDAAVLVDIGFMIWCARNELLPGTALFARFGIAPHTVMTTSCCRSRLRDLLEMETQPDSAIALRARAVLASLQVLVCDHAEPVGDHECLLWYMRYNRDSYYWVATSAEGFTERIEEETLFTPVILLHRDHLVLLRAPAERLVARLRAAMNKRSRRRYRKQLFFKPFLRLRAAVMNRRISRRFRR